MRLKILLLLALFLAPILVHADTHDTSILLIYGSEEDKTQIESLVTDQGITLDPVAIENLTTSDINSAQMIIFASSEEFSTDEIIETALLNFLADPGHYFLMISPYADEFSGDLTNAIGIDNYVELIDNSTLSWTIEADQDFGNFTSGDEFTYSGRTGLVILETTATSIASFTTVSVSELDQEYELPRSAIWSVNDSAFITFVSTSLVDEPNGNLELDQVGEFLTSLIPEIVNTVVSQYVVSQTGNTTDPPTSGNTGTNTSTDDTNIANTTDTETNSTDVPTDAGPGNISVPSLPELSLIGAILAFLAIFYAKILGFLNWLGRKLYGVLFFVIGAFYNVQDRTLSHNEVMMNASRADIIDYLNHVGAYGAHLREIKSVTSMGSGSLLWHLQVLEDYGYIDKYSVDSYTIFVAEGFTFDFDLKLVELQLQSKYTYDLLEYLEHSDEFAIDLGNIEEATGINRRPLRRLLKKMADEDLVAIERYPEMTIQILEKNKIKELYLSFDLRRSFSFDKQNPQIDYIE